MNKKHRLGIGVFWVTFLGIWLILIKSKRTRIAVKHKQELLVVRPWLGNGKWSLPGGGRHPGENPKEAVLRELHEETGVQLAEHVVTHLSHQRYRQNGLRFWYDLFTAQIDHKVDILLKKREISAAEWVEYTKLTPRNANDDVIAAVKTVF